jgi:hypothetical protein
MLVWITVKSLSRSVLASVVCLATGVTAKPLVSPSLATVGMRSSKGHYPAAILTAGDVSTRAHEPPHLQVSSTKKMIEFPRTPNARGKCLQRFNLVCETRDHVTAFLNYLVNYERDLHQSTIGVLFFISVTYSVIVALEIFL